MPKSKIFFTNGGMYFPKEGGRQRRGITTNYNKRQKAKLFLAKKDIFFYKTIQLFVELTCLKLLQQSVQYKNVAGAIFTKLDQQVSSLSVNLI